MRKVTLVAAFVLFVAGCSSTSEPMAVQITGFLGPAEEPAAISGLAVEEDVVCAAAIFEQFQFDDLDGKVLSDDEVSQMMQVGDETGDVVFSAIHNRWTCTDGSGSFVTVDFPKMGMGDMDFEGVNEVSNWEIESGTGDYEKLTGTGAITVDFIKGEVVYTGEMQNG